MSESSRVWHLIKKNAAGRWERVEPHILGFPDCIAVVTGQTFLAELKHLERWPPRSATNLELKPHQINFLRNWPGKWCVIARVGSEWLILDRLPEVSAAKLSREQWITYGKSIEMGIGFWQNFNVTIQGLLDR